MSAAATIPSLIPLVVVIAMRRAEASIRRQLADAGAWSADSAVPFSPSRSFERRRLQCLIRGGAVRVTPDGGHFLDADGWNKYQGDRRRRVLYAMSVIVALVGIGFGVALAMR